uniref:Reticulon-like protein n=1 Tax=Ditylenchus dipsaci TaxID=166011 RepID=A0A915D6J8_9BILA
MGQKYRKNSKTTYEPATDLPGKLLEIIYWRDPKRSGGALAVLLVALYLFAKCSLLSLVAYASLTALAGTIGFRVFKLEISVPQERVHSQVDVLVEHGQALVKHLRHLFLVENLVDSVKFGMLLYTLTYVGSWFSGISLVLIFIIALFTVPKFYEVYKEPVDHYVGIAKENIDKVQHQISDKLPFLKKVPEGEKKEQ